MGVVRKLAAQSLEEAILYTAEYTIKKLASQNLPIHPATLDCYKDVVGLANGKELNI